MSVSVSELCGGADGAPRPRDGPQGRPCDPDLRTATNGSDRGSPPRVRRAAAFHRFRRRCQSQRAWRCSPRLAEIGLLAALSELSRGGRARATTKPADRRGRRRPAPDSEQDACRAHGTRPAAGATVRPTVLAGGSGSRSPSTSVPQHFDP